jgi:DNA gyrase/topoisomerase IV subunit A
MPLTIKNKTITHQINTHFRDYAFYTLENRGIPSFYDGLTNVQRLAVWLAPNTFRKTIALVGDMISNNYHHGNASAETSVSRLAKPIGCALNLLQGDGFFGNEVAPEPAAARYTSVKLNPVIRPHIERYAILNHLPTNDIPKVMYTDVPIGLCTGVIGIAVGYKTIILPRKLDQLKQWLETEEADLTPYFQGFSGTVEPATTAAGSPNWKISGTVKWNRSAAQIEITSIPPTMSYERFLVKLSDLLEPYDVRVTNSSSETISIMIGVSRINTKLVQELVDKIQKINSQLVKEMIVLVKDNQILQYESIEDYLKDFKDNLNRVEFQYLDAVIQKTQANLDFLSEKQLWIEWFVKEVKGSGSAPQRTQIQVYMESVSDPKIREKLKGIPGWTMNDQELDSIRDQIKQTGKSLQGLRAEQSGVAKRIAKLPMNLRVVKNQFSQEIEDEFNGIQFLDIEESLEETLL